ncbi:MAG TPA: hypothetical protein VJR89_11480 [Polyangiales bacterium]|nr:hypothetical protein [Polyangiales bacterium]
MPAEILAKGSNFVGLLKALEALNGTDARDRVLAALPETVAEPLRFGQVVAVGWYPVTWYAELHDAIERSFHRGPALARKLSHQATAADIGSIHRFIASMLSVETVFGQTHRLMGLYWKGGAIERLEIAAGRARVRFEGWHGFTALIWEDLMGGMEAVLETCGAKNGRCKPSGRIDQVDTLEIDVRWG